MEYHRQGARQTLRPRRAKAHSAPLRALPPGSPATGTPPSGTGPLPPGALPMQAMHLASLPPAQTNPSPRPPAPVAALSAPSHTLVPAHGVHAQKGVPTRDTSPLLPPSLF